MNRFLAKDSKYNYLKRGKESPVNKELISNQQQKNTETLAPSQRMQLTNFHNVFFLYKVNKQIVILH